MLRERPSAPTRLRGSEGRGPGWEGQRGHTELAEPLLPSKQESRLLPHGSAGRRPTAGTAGPVLSQAGLLPGKIAFGNSGKSEVANNGLGLQT